MTTHTTRNQFCNIYLITNTLNQKKYIGQTWYDINQRLQRHSRQSRRGCPLLYRAIVKHGLLAFTIELLTIATDQNHADQLEQQYIQHYDSTNQEKGYNISGGGQDGRPSMPEEMRQRISDKMTGIKRSPQTIQKMIDGHQGYVQRLSPQSQTNLNASRIKKRKLTMEQASQIRDKSSQGIMAKHLAKEYGVSITIISFIINNKTYINTY
jgi:group I intron endonuclease